MKNKNLYLVILLLPLFLLQYSCYQKTFCPAYGNYSSPRWGHFEINTESYAEIKENSFIEVSQEAISTFSADVDVASYANVRRFLNQGELPPVDAVRIEEMINYFTYNDRFDATQNHPYSIHTELAACPWNPKHQLARITLAAKEISRADQKPVNLVFLIDVSGSMSAYNKLPLLKKSLHLLVNELRPEDKVAIVTYASTTAIALPSTPGNEKNKIMGVVNGLGSEGFTAGGEGLKLAYQVAKSNYDAAAVNRVILCTDGDFNLGESSDEAMAALIKSKRDDGIFITCLGFGMGNYKDSKIETIADKGNGNYGYIDNIMEAQKLLVKEIGSTLQTIAKDVKLQVEFNPQKISAYRLIGYENRLLENTDFVDDKKDAGEMGSGHTVTALYEIVPATNTTGDANGYRAAERILSPPEEIPGDEWLYVKTRYKMPDEDVSALYTVPLTGTASTFQNASQDLQWAATVAGFGMVLRDSKFKEDLTFDKLIALAIQAKGTDEEGYRSEFITLLQKAANIQAGKASK